MDTESMNNYHAREGAPFLIAEICAKMYTSKNWHKLTTLEKAVVDQLVIGEFLGETRNGFCGELPAW